MLRPDEAEAGSFSHDPENMLAGANVILVGERHVGHRAVVELRANVEGAIDRREVAPRRGASGHPLRREADAFNSLVNMDAKERDGDRGGRWTTGVLRHRGFDNERRRRRGRRLAFDVDPSGFLVDGDAKALDLGGRVALRFEQRHELNLDVVVALEIFEVSTVSPLGSVILSSSRRSLLVCPAADVPRTR